jgi:hypothetical protein
MAMSGKCAPFDHGDQSLGNRLAERGQPGGERDAVLAEPRRKRSGDLRNRETASRQALHDIGGKRVGNRDTCTRVCLDDDERRSSPRRRAKRLLLSRPWQPGNHDDERRG